MDVVDWRLRSRKRGPCRLSTSPTVSSTRRITTPRRPPSKTMLSIAPALLLVFLASTTIVVAAAPSTTTTETLAPLVIDLVPSSSQFGGLVKVFLGPDDAQQPVRLLPTLKIDSTTIVQAPGPELCALLPDPNSWNRIRKPCDGDVISVNVQLTGIASMMETVRWTPLAGGADDMVGLVLRKGRGENPPTVAQIEGAMRNDGEYIWDVSKTYRELGLQESDDYSLMLFTNSAPPRTSSSGYFALETTTLTSPIAPGVYKAAPGDTTDPSTRKKCIEFLKSNGGFYNLSSDASYKKSDFAPGIFDKSSLGREVSSSASGFSQLALSVGGRNFKVDNGGIDTIMSSTLGAGTIALNALQKSRGLDDQLNVVALYAGSDKHSGSIVLGGYDLALVDAPKSAVFSKGLQHPDIVVLPMDSVTISNADRNITISSKQGRSNIALSWDSQGLRLPSEILDSILPIIGNPTYDGSVGGYVYSNNTNPPQEAALIFNFNNGTKELSVSIPISSLLLTESEDDNPITPLQESGRQYLALSPTPDGTTTGSYLGRRFLQSVYIIDSPTATEKFHLSIIPSKLPSEKNIIAASSSSLALFNGILPPSHSTISSKTSRLIAGLAGGLAAVIILLIVLWLYHRGASRSRRHRRRQRRQIKQWFEYNEKHSESKESVHSVFKDLGFRPSVQPVPPVKKQSRLRHIASQWPKRKDKGLCRGNSISIQDAYNNRDFTSSRLGKELSSNVEGKGKQVWSPYSSPIHADSSSSSGLAKELNAFPAPVDEKRDSILSMPKPVRRSDHNVSHILSREYFSPPAAKEVVDNDDPPVGHVLKRNPTMSRAEIDLKHCSSYGEMYMTDDDGISVLFEDGRHSSVLDPGTPNPQTPGETPIPSSSTTLATFATHPFDSHTSNVPNPPGPRPLSVISSVSSHSIVSHPSRVSSITRNSIISQLSPLQRVLSMNPNSKDHNNQQLPQIPSRSPSSSPPDSPILRPTSSATIQPKGSSLS
ncbi:hypothetical protein EX30DRAFT_395011 [Ascodesmis nigricans]|uniref:Uncharacterized protein n=1 Tax=Ascodesmis nigricans TaxID=341454 RepID=A0A4S2MZK3_9PEZI|nr:hypothetical protein EX30DRAFT_395011 [Ascodesmis nigricans]